jgi:hypothetical protein
MFLIKQRASRYALLAILITWAFGLPTTNAQTFDLSDATDLVPVNVKAAAEYKGRKAVLITRDVLDLKIEHWPVERLVPYARNARTHSEGQVAQLAASIAEFGL